MLRPRTADLATYRHVFFFRPYEVVLRRPPATIVDCGANVGFASVFFANAYPGATIVAIEPELSNFSLLATNIAPYAKIMPMRLAVWGCNTVLDIRADDVRRVDCFQTVPVDDRANNVIGTVAARTIDAIMTMIGIERIDLLKIDIEGAEAELFANPRAWIDRVGVLAIEFHDELQPDCRALVSRCTADLFPFELHQRGCVFLATPEFACPDFQAR